jgi:hydroxyacyl-ACP dehydratase HTD2-like protein with hotdog domain
MSSANVRLTATKQWKTFVGQKQMQQLSKSANVHALTTSFVSQMETTLLPEGWMILCFPTCLHLVSFLPLWPVLVLA